MKPLRHPLVFAGPGHRSAQTLLMLDERDALIIEIAHRFYPGASDREVARQLRSRLLIYRGGRWRRTCAENLCPHAAERIDAWLWRSLKVRDAVASERTIRFVLARARCDANPQTFRIRSSRSCALA